MQRVAEHSLPYSLDLKALDAAYGAGELTPRRVVSDVLARIEADRVSHAWIHVFPRDALLARAAELERDSGRAERLPLYGVPFAVKDNIDVQNHPTTAACPAYRYVATESADAVRRLERAGAICIGKTNMDQFATGLVGTRSPYGACANPFDARYISGGSSSGSAVAVALGQVTFALGTDTAGSGRVPAAFCNIVGLKPTRGLVSTRGVVPACRSLDCVSVFALTVDDAWSVLEIGALASDDSGARAPGLKRRPALGAPLRCGVLRAADLQFFGDDAADRAYAQAREKLESLGADLVEIDYTPFAEAGRLLYEGPWLAERLAAIKSFYERSSSEMHPVVREIIGGGRRFTGVDVFEGHDQLRLLESRCAEVWQRVDVLVVPTTGTIYRIAQVAADPISLNSNLGRYTNFVNLLDLSAIAVPAGFRDDGLPFGMTFVAPAFEDALAAHWAARFHEQSRITLGATGCPLRQRQRESRHGATVEALEGRR
jgi:allophanate hydrolase